MYFEYKHFETIACDVPKRKKGLFIPPFVFWCCYSICDRAYNAFTAFAPFFAPRFCPMKSANRKAKNTPSPYSSASTSLSVVFVDFQCCTSQKHYSLGMVKK